jgi:hypothetical protein
MAQRYSGLPSGQKPYLRISQDPSALADLKTRVIGALGANATKLIAFESGITSAKGLFGIYNFTGGQVGYAQHMSRWLAAAPAACIIMCHPAQGGWDPGDVDDGIAVARQWEFDYLSSDAFAQALTAQRVYLR